MDTRPENKKTKILIVLAASTAATLIFVVPWFSNQMSYEEYSKVEAISIRKSNEQMNRVSKFTIKARNNYNADARAYYFMYEQEKEKWKNHEKILAMNRCINRYRSRNYHFALAMIACKTELF